MGMACATSFGKGCSTSPVCCDKFGCCPGVCPDFTLKRNDTEPPFKVSVEDCDGPIDLTGLIVEGSMWAKAKLKKNMTVTDTYFQVADDIGFEQMMVGDIIIMDRTRLPEHMLVTGFDEDNRFVQVQRGYNGTFVSAWKKGTALRIVKIMNAPAESQMVVQDITEIDGTVRKNVIMESLLVYHWQAGEVCLPGCYYFEFKLIKMLPPVADLSSSSDDVIPSFTSLTRADYGCVAVPGVEWMRRYPVNSEGYVIQIMDSLTIEYPWPPNPPLPTPPPEEPEAEHLGEPNCPEDDEPRANRPPYIVTECQHAMEAGGTVPQPYPNREIAPGQVLLPMPK